MNLEDYKDQRDRYGLVSRVLHWGMALLFAAQFLSAAAHWGLERGTSLRDFFWDYHTDLGFTLFILVMLRGIWGLVNVKRRPPLHTGTMGYAAVAGHIALYAFMVIVPATRIIAAAGGTRGFEYFGIQIFPPATQRSPGWMVSQNGTENSAGSSPP